MTFDARESSIDLGQPIWLYDFSRLYLHWRYTSADADQLWSNYTWSAVAISHDRIAMSSETARNVLTLTAPADLIMAQQYRVIGPSDPILLTVRKMHQGDTEAAIEWMGRVSAVSWPRQHCIIHAVPATADMSQTGLRRTVSRNCPYALYSVDDCRLPKLSKQNPATLTAITPTTVTAVEFAAHPDGYFTGGEVDWEVEVGIWQRRFVLNHIGDTLTLLSGSVTMSVGLAVLAYPGCKHTLQACSDLGNLNNYGGQAYLPTRSPFDGQPVY